MAYIATVIIELPRNIKTDGEAADYVSTVLQDLGDRATETDGAWQYPGINDSYQYARDYQKGGMG